MSTKRPTTAGLTPETCKAILEILRRVGFIADRKAICDLYKISPKRLAYFLLTVQAQDAATEATDLSRLEFFNELKARTDPDPPHPSEPSDSPRDSQWDATIVELTPTNGISSRDARTIRKLSDSASRKQSSMTYFKRVGAEMTEEEFDKWDKLAESRK